MRRIANYLHRIMAEPDGTPSFGRWCSAFFAVCAAGWISWVVWRKHDLPDLGGIPTLVTAPYGSNKLTTALQSGIAALKGKINGGAGTADTKPQPEAGREET